MYDHERKVINFQRYRNSPTARTTALVNEFLVQMEPR